MKVLFCYFFGMFCCLPHSESCLTLDLRTPWLCLWAPNKTPWLNMQHQVLHLHPWLLLPLQHFLGSHVPGHRQSQPWEVSAELLLNCCHPLGCLALRHPSCIPALPTRGGGRGVRTGDQGLGLQGNPARHPQECSIPARKQQFGEGWLAAVWCEHSTAGGSSASSLGVRGTWL